MIERFVWSDVTFYPSLPLFAGVGTRNYYRKIGYELDGPYMSKSL